MQKKIWISLAVAVAVVLMLSGCSFFKAPQQKQPDTPGPVPQRQAIQGAEPDILVYMHETGEKKTMKMEEYIAGVVAGEMKPEWPVAALAAQAIIARTFTIEAMESKNGVPAHGTQASTDIKEFQAYNGKAVNDHIKQAVQMTKGLVITYQDKAAKTWFHASAGGITATAKEGLDYKEAEPPYIASVTSPDDLAPEDVKSWTAAFSHQELLNTLIHTGQDITSIESVDIGKKGPSGRAMSIIVNKTAEVSAPEMRLALGSTKLKSMLLDKIEVTADKVIFYGKGYGHGVGMSQWGAYKMAQDGKKPEEIIAHYFRGVTLEKRWE